VTSDTYMDMETPGLGATFSAPGTWLMANSRYGRVSRTTAVPAARMRFLAAILSSWTGAGGHRAARHLGRNDTCGTMRRVKTKTTIMLPEDLLVAAKEQAARERSTLGALIERGLRRELSAGKRAPAAKRQRIRWVTVAGGLPPGLDVGDRVAMHDWL